MSILEATGLVLYLRIILSILRLRENILNSEKQREIFFLLGRI
jgi:hypothetical protein